MFNSLSIISIALVAASSASGLIIPRHRAINLAVRSERPDSYAEGYLEHYRTYHLRYLAIGCDQKHNTKFFDKCCHPLLATETLKANRPAECAPKAAEMSSASAALPTTTIQPDSNGDNVCDDEDTTSTDAPKATHTPENAAHAHPKDSPKKESSTEKPSTETHTSTASKSKATSSSSSAPSGGSQTGGDATFFTQNGNAGACGKVHQDSDFICAIDQARYGDAGAQSPLCGKQVKIVNSNNGKSVTCTIADDCPTCKNKNSIDLSVAAFTQIATKSEGEVPIRWTFV